MSTTPIRTTGPAPAAEGRTSVAARLDRIPPFKLHRRMGIAVGFGNFFDLYDIFLGGVLAAVLAEEWNLSTSGKALCISSGFAGMFFGASLLGTLADRWGRRRTFLLEILIYSGFTLAAAFSPNLAVLAILRFCAGVGLGGELSLADTYLSEILPKQVRGRYMARAYTLSFFGVPLAAFIGAKFVAGEHILGTDGWRWLLVVGSLGALIVFAMRRSLPESPRYYEMRGDNEAADRAARTIEDAALEELGVDELPEPEHVEIVRAEKAAVRDIFEPPYGRRSLMLWIFQFLQTVGYYGFGTLAPLVLKSKGYDIVESLGFTAVIYCGYPLGSALSVPLMDRFERKHLIVASALAIGGFGVVFGFARAGWLIVAAGFCVTAVSNVFSNSFHIYQAEIFPTRIRGTAVGIAYSLSRLSGAILPFITVAVLDNLGASTVFVGCAAIMAIVALDVALLGPRSTGQVLEASSDEMRAGSGRFHREGRVPQGQSS
ncbi:MAG TPA: MFS transporter [Solirubrobacteraceae bacterium]|jgi:putative MFS transporter